MNIGNTLIMPRTRVVLLTGNMKTVARNFINPKTETEILSKSIKVSNVKKFVRKVVAAVLKNSKTIRTIVKNNPVVSRAWEGMWTRDVSKPAAVNSGSGDVFKSRVPVTLDDDEALSKRLSSREKLKELIFKDMKQNKADAAKLSAKKTPVVQAEPKKAVAGEPAEKPVSEQSNSKKMSKARFNDAVLARLEEKSKKSMRALEEAKIAQNKVASEFAPENFSENDEILQWL
ncbi:MAG: hypothetical protein ACI4CY_02130 [Candidatus Gastranaerophilaceae bacterium]